MALATHPVKTEDFSDQEQQGLVLVAEAEDLKVVDQATFDAAAEMLKNIKAYLKAAMELTDPAVKAGKAAHQAALDLRGKLTDKAEEAEKIIKYGAKGDQRNPDQTSMAGYQTIQKDLADKAKAEAEQIRRKAEADAVAKSKATGKPVQAVVVFTPPVPAVPKASGVAFVDNWTFEITDASLIPQAYLMPDEKKIGAVVKALKKDAEASIPGIRAFPSNVVRA